jgi:hypothetical protein
LTEIQQFRTGVRAALSDLEIAMSLDDIDEAHAFAIRAANGLLQSSEPKPVAAQRSYCANPVCRRLITENDPIFAGHCSTICRESFNVRVKQTVHEKFEGAQ